MGTPVKFKIMQSEEAFLDADGIADGTICFVLNEGSLADGVDDTERTGSGIWLVYGSGKKIKMSGFGAGTGVDIPPETMVFLGIAEDTELPTTASVTIGGEQKTAKENSVIAFNQKEYIYCKNSSGTFEWRELGDEEAAPTWEVDS